MSATSDSRVETAKLARLLEVEDPQALAFLLKVPAAQLRDYREAVTEVLYDDQAELLARTADAARLLPERTLAAIGERALGPLICARLTGLLDPRRAADISEHFTLEFLARLAAELDPRRATEVVSAIEADTVVAICAAMAENHEHVAMGRFVAYLDEVALRRCIEVLGDEDLLRVAFMTEGEARVSWVLQMIGAVRTTRILAAARANGLVEEAEHVLAHLPGGAPADAAAEGRSR